MRVHHLAGGMTPLSGGLLGSPPAGFRARSFPFHVLLAESDDGLVLVDTGAPGAALEHVRALGFDACEVRHVVLTTLQHDHAAGLSDFPDALVHVLAAEHTAASRRGPLARRRHGAPPPQCGVRWRVHVPRGAHWFGFDCVREASLPDGIALVPLPGPSGGHAGVAVHGDHGWVLHAGDAYLWHDEVHSAAPPSRSAVAIARQLADADPAGRSWTLERLRVVAGDPDGTILVVSSHDPLELDACAERNPPTRARRPVRRQRPMLRLVASR